MNRRNHSRPANSRTRMKMLVPGFAGLLFLILLASGCFKVRDVEPPSTSSDWVSPTDYQILLENFERAISQKNSQNFLRCLNGDHFVFNPAPQVLALDNQSIFVNWSTIDEQTWFENVVADLGVVTGNSVDVQESNLLDVTADSVKFVGTYQMLMQHSDTSLSTTFEGQVEFLFRVNAYNEWEIHRWKDFETAPDSSWSLLKLRYAQ